MRKSDIAGVLVVTSIFIVIPAVEAQGANCAQTCVEIRREGGELVITARRDPVRVTRPSVTQTPAPTPSLKPSPTPSTSPSKAPATSPPRRKAPARSARATRPRPTLSDQIRELLPEGSFRTLPQSGALINEPLLVRALGCTELTKQLPILDTTVELRLRPVIHWVWGDGTNEVWAGSATRGAHIYTRSGRYVIQMRCQWSGWFRTPHSPWAPIPEGIASVAQQRVELFRAHVFFTE